MVNGTGRQGDETGRDVSRRENLIAPAAGLKRESWSRIEISPMYALLLCHQALVAVSNPFNSSGVSHGDDVKPHIPEPIKVADKII